MFIGQHIRQRTLSPNRPRFLAKLVLRRTAQPTRAVVDSRILVKRSGGGGRPAENKCALRSVDAFTFFPFALAVAEEAKDDGHNEENEPDSAKGAAYDDANFGGGGIGGRGGGRGGCASRSRSGGHA